MCSQNCDVSWSDVLTAIGTVGAVAVALFGSLIPKWFPPNLRIRIADGKGKYQRVNVVGADRDARFYQVEVTNNRRWSKAHNVQVLLHRIEIESTTGWVDQWEGGGIPLVLQHQQVLGSVRIVGPQVLADLLNVVKGIKDVINNQLSITPQLIPHGVIESYSNACALRFTIKAVSDEADSNMLMVTVRWDGQWHDGATEMAQHVLVESARGT
jgi:hypothetical protein